MYESIVETKHRPNVLYLIGSSVIGKQKLTSGTPGCLGPWPDWSKGLPLRRCRSDSGEDKHKQKHNGMKLRNWNTTFSLSPHPGSSSSGSRASSPRNEKSLNEDER